MRKKVIILISVCFISFLAYIGFMFMKTMQESDEVSLQFVDMNTIADGTYQGECNLGLVHVEVKLTVQNKKIVAIQVVEHKQGMGKKAEVIVDDIIRQNGVQVDTIASATVSSKAIMKASENALLGK